MVTMPHLAVNMREQAIGVLRSGVAEARAAMHFGVYQCTISHLQVHYAQTGATVDRP